MTRKDIANQLARRTGLTASQAAHAVEEIINIAADAIVTGEPILLRGFGRIKLVKRAAKPGRNITNGTKVMIPERKQVKFVAYNGLQERINRADNETKNNSNKWHF